jgi:hypothetical protein
VSRTSRRFRHPHLSYGIVYTAFGAFQVHRGIIEAPEEVGTRCGWVVLEPDDTNDSRSASAALNQPGVVTRAH